MAPIMVPLGPLLLLLLLLLLLVPPLPVCPLGATLVEVDGLLLLVGELYAGLDVGVEPVLAVVRGLVVVVVVATLELLLATADGGGPVVAGPLLEDGAGPTAEHIALIELTACS
ncbi:uncharacterized protein B0I36DRAFT_341503 [Microdochium trichocladiopsis]|uniref:Secreted protein n=1 Tax=Microdochium trichocladiopsis TaxID=1682393 RepID=A0A9P8XTA5_9PEZI|nr:uncharacterized protein B0I36DRAFT_341503 [Microdochium trichocladiopsis]KAH7010889.1 hypothetical protein B0I36DRAFT_341503 [Microdochium trichocladiopsis]